MLCTHVKGFCLHFGYNFHGFCVFCLPGIYGDVILWKHWFVISVRKMILSKFGIIKDVNLWVIMRAIPTNTMKIEPHLILMIAQY